MCVSGWVQVLVYKCFWYVCVCVAGGEGEGAFTYGSKEELIDVCSEWSTSDVGNSVSSVSCKYATLTISAHAHAHAHANSTHTHMHTHVGGNTGTASVKGPKTADKDRLAHVVLRLLTALSESRLHARQPDSDAQNRAKDVATDA